MPTVLARPGPSLSTPTAEPPSSPTLASGAGVIRVEVRTEQAPRGLRRRTVVAVLLAAGAASLALVVGVSIGQEERVPDAGPGPALTIEPAGAASRKTGPARTAAPGPSTATAEVVADGGPDGTPEPEPATPTPPRADVPRRATARPATKREGEGPERSRSRIEPLREYE